jgi:hypothetical protein
VRGQWIVFGLHRRQFGFDVADCCGESFKCVLKSCRPQYCSCDHIPGNCQARSDPAEMETRKFAVRSPCRKD